MSELTPEPPLPDPAAVHARVDHPKRRLVIGTIAALGGSAAAIAAVFIFVPTNHKTLVTGPIVSASTSTDAPRPTATTTPATPSPSPATSPPSSPSPAATLSPPPPSPTETSRPTPAITSTPATPTTSDTTDNAQIIAGFNHVSDVYFHYLSTSDLDMSMLSNVATERSYQKFLATIEKERAANEIMKGTPVMTDVRVTQRPSPTLAIVCATEDDSPTAYVDADTGKVKASGFNSYTFGTEMIRAGDVWKAYQPVSSC